MRVFLGAIALSILSLGAVTATTSGEGSVRATGEATKQPEVEAVGAGMAIDLEEAAAVQQEVDTYLAVQHYFNLLEEEKAVKAYLDALYQESLRRAVAVRPAPRSTVQLTVGECTGFAIPDYIIQRESGGNPNAYNPSGAYGCAQTLLSHYGEKGTCAGLNPYDIQGQRDCVDRLSNGGTNLNPWAQTR